MIGRIAPDPHVPARRPRLRRYPPAYACPNVVTGGEADEQRAYGDFLDKGDRYARCDEFLTVLADLWRGRTVDADGQFVRVRGARLSRLPDPAPEIYFGGSSPAALDVAARHADVYLTWGEPPDAVAAKVVDVRTRAAAVGRHPRFGLRAHVIARDTAEEAWAAARRLLHGVDVGGRRTGPRGCRDRAGRQPHRGGGSRRDLPPGRGQRVRALRLPPPGGGVLVR